jgi:hypothetical protein
LGSIATAAAAGAGAVAAAATAPQLAATGQIEQSIERGAVRVWAGDGGSHERVIGVEKEKEEEEENRGVGWMGGGGGEGD